MHGKRDLNIFTRRNVSSPVSFGMCMSNSTRCTSWLRTIVQRLFAVAGQ